MVNQQKYFYLSGIITIFITTTMLFTLLYYTVNIKKIKKFTLSKSITIDLTFIEQKKLTPKPVIKPQPVIAKPVEKKIEKVTKEKVVKKQNQSFSDIGDMSSLFDDVKIAKSQKVKYVKKNIVNQKTISRLSRKRTEFTNERKVEQKAKDLVQRPTKVALKINVQTAKSAYASDGELNEYYAKIQSLLAQNWYPSSESAGKSAKVSVSIDSLGNFDYNVPFSSLNDAFLEELLTYLESLKKQKFPPYEKGGKTVIEVYFTAQESE